ncbi:hypothetical protein SD457_05125 [Coprobacillaceae bacterium CR2/5/TPMF4]|nr:hypothetical protein SD457_05125 [Coprobacillaceae bacterium CR2/5/TPMF4]
MLNKYKDYIGVFDSGVGGISVLKELTKILPNENFIFLVIQLMHLMGKNQRKR